MEEDENILIPQLDPSNTINDSDQFIKQEGARTFRADASVIRDYVVNAVTAALILQRLQTVDGPGSGLNADLLDGQQASFFRDAANLEGTLDNERINRQALFSSLVPLSGTGTGWDADLLDGQQGSYYRNATNLNAGTIPSARLNHLDIFNQILTRDGTGSTLDADLLDGLQGSDYRNASNLNAGTVPLGRLNIPEIFASIRNIDGAGSTLDADLLDGNHGSYYRNASNLNAGTVPLDRLPAAGTGSPGIVELTIFTEALTNGIANRAITPDSLYDATRGTNNSSGESYWPLPGGWFVQTGRITTGIQSLANGQTLNFPTAFPTQCVAFFPVWFGNHSSDDNTVSGLAISRSQYQLYFSAGTREPGVQWVAIGR